MNLVVKSRDGSVHVIYYDRADSALVNAHSWRVERHDHTDYAATTVRRPDGGYTTTYMHRLLLNALPRVQVDHVNRNGLDNRRKNIRIATSSQNMANQAKSKIPRSSIYKGVTWHHRGQKWQAQIAVSGKRRYLGLHSTEEDAALTYNQAALAAWGDRALLNEVP